MCSNNIVLDWCMNSNHYTRLYFCTSVYTTLYYYVTICFCIALKFLFRSCNCCYFNLFLIEYTLQFPFCVGYSPSRLRIWLYLAFSIISSNQLMHIFIKNTLKSHKIHFTPTCFGSYKIHLQGAIIIILTKVFTGSWSESI